MWDCDGCDACWEDEFGKDICSMEDMDIEEMSYCPEEDEEWCYDCDSHMNECECKTCEECGGWEGDCFCEGQEEEDFVECE